MFDLTQLPAPSSESPDPTASGFFMYVLTCADGSLYTGYSRNVASRLEAHQRGTASKYTRSRLPVQLSGWWEFSSQREAMQAEIAFKSLTRMQKLRIIDASNAQMARPRGTSKPRTCIASRLHPPKRPGLSS